MNRDTLKLGILWTIIVIAWLLWIFNTAGCSNESAPMPDAASGLPWCADLGCPKIHESDRACGATRVCYCEMQRCEPVSPLRDNGGTP